MNAMKVDTKFEMDVAKERQKAVKPFKKVGKFLSYPGLAVVGYVFAIAVVVLLVAAVNS